MPIDILTLENDKQWLAARRKDVTASVVGALFGIHEFTTPFALWADKAGKAPVEDTMNAAIMRGKLMESVAVEVLSMDNPDWEVTHNTGEGVKYFRDTDSRLGATPDMFVSCPLRGKGVVQIKSVEASIFRKKWCSGDIPEPPLWIALQAAVEAHLTGSSWAAVAPIVVSHGIEVPLIEIPISEKVISSIYLKVKQFWEMIDRGEEPEPNFSLDAGNIDSIYGGDGSEIDLSSDKNINDLVQEYQIVNEKFLASQSRIEEIKSELKYAMKGSEMAYLRDGKRMTWRRQKRRYSDGTIKVNRVLRIPKFNDIAIDSSDSLCADEPRNLEKPVYDKWKF